MSHAFALDNFSVIFVKIVVFVIFNLFIYNYVVDDVCEMKIGGFPSFIFISIPEIFMVDGDKWF